MYQLYDFTPSWAGTTSTEQGIHPLQMMYDILNTYTICALWTSEIEGLYSVFCGHIRLTPPRCDLSLKSPQCALSRLAGDMKRGK